MKPHIKRVVLQSDNAKCYQGGLLALGIWILGFSDPLRNIFVQKLIHTETQDGKGSIDAHFAVLMRHLITTVDEAANAATAKEVFDGLNARGGMNNVVTVLFRINRKKIQTLLDQYISSNSKLVKVTRYNEAKFTADYIQFFAYSGCEITYHHNS